MFPDLFAFAPPFAWLAFSLVTGGMQFSDLPRPDAAPEMSHSGFAVFELAEMLYRFSHSFAVFGMVMLLLWLWKRRFYFILLGWPLHVLYDIPTHTPEFYPTPLFWPLSDWTFPYGFSWGQPWFIALNYSLLLIVYAWLYVAKRRRGR